MKKRKILSNNRQNLPFFFLKCKNELEKRKLKYLIRKCFISTKVDCVVCDIENTNSNHTMTKHGICPSSKKRQYGKGRRVKRGVMPPGVMVPGALQIKNGLEPAFYGGWRTSADKANRRLKNRRARKSTRSSVVSVQSELKEEKEAKKHERKKMEKEHDKETRQMQKRFLRKIHELWEKQEKELLALANSI